MSGLDRKKHCAEGGLEAVPPALSTLLFSYRLEAPRYRPCTASPALCAARLPIRK